MERYYSTGQSPQRAVTPREEEEDISRWYRDFRFCSDVVQILTIFMLFASIRLNVGFWELNALYSVLGWVLKTTGDA
jgi:hypothetical protein